jgi:ERCC4-type nuclease
MIIKVDNREKDLIPLIERRLEAYALETSTTTTTTTAKKNIKNGCLVPLHMFQDVDVCNEVLSTDINTGEVREAGDGRENRKIHKMKIEQLHIGDIVFENDSGSPILIFERKTLNDLAASIKDGRYNEQSFRLDKEAIHNHNIIYIIEGDIERYNEKKTHISKKTLTSSMFSLLYYKGFSVIRTNTIFETADTIVFFADKYDKTFISDKTRKPYYDLKSHNDDDGDDDHGVKECDDEDKHDSCVKKDKEKEKEKEKEKDKDKDKDESEKYCDAFKGHKEKNEYITPENINIIMLSCIPAINSKTATQIMSEYKTIQNLLYQLEKEPECLNTFMIKTESGNMRKINKNCVDNIKKFLLNK